MKNVKKNIVRITKDKVSELSLFKQIISYRELIYILFKRDIITTYKQTILGPFWIIINPLVTSFVFTIIFGKVAKIPTDGIPSFLFYFSALTIWNFFYNNVISISNFFNTNREFFSKVYFTRIVIPLSNILTNSLRFLIQFFILLLFCFFIFDLKLNFSMQFLFIIIYCYVYIFLFSLGVGLFLNSFTYKYKDLSNIIVFLLTIWMYLSPVVYPISEAPLKLKFILSINPIASVIEIFRSGIFNLEFNINIFSYSFSIIFLIVILSIGILMYKKTEKNFIDIA